MLTRALNLLNRLRMSVSVFCAVVLGLSIAACNRTDGESLCVGVWVPSEISRQKLRKRYAFEPFLCIIFESNHRCHLILAPKPRLKRNNDNGDRDLLASDRFSQMGDGAGIASGSVVCNGGIVTISFDNQEPLRGTIRASVLTIDNMMADEDISFDRQH